MIWRLLCFIGFQLKATPITYILTIICWNDDTSFESSNTMIPFPFNAQQKFQSFVKNVYHSYHGYSLNLVFNCCLILLLAQRKFLIHLSSSPPPTLLSRPCCVCVGRKSNLIIVYPCKTCVFKLSHNQIMSSRLVLKT